MVPLTVMETHCISIKPYVENEQNENIFIGICPAGTILLFHVGSISTHSPAQISTHACATKDRKSVV